MNPAESERRAFPRVAAPLIVELSHPAIGRIHMAVRDVSENGLFLQSADAGPLSRINKGARVQITPVAIPLIANMATPVVTATVVRKIDAGIGLQIETTSGRYLWSTVRHLREELALGHDYFRLFCGAVIKDAHGALLVREDRGRFVFPGRFLTANEHWKTGCAQFVRDLLHVDAPTPQDVLLVDTFTSEAAPENAMVILFALSRLDAAQPAPAGHRWLHTDRDVIDCKFTCEVLRGLAINARRAADLHPPPHLDRGTQAGAHPQP